MIIQQKLRLTLSLQLGASEDDDVNRHVIDWLFSTLTNVNFDQSRFRDEYIPKAMELRERAKASYLAAAAKAGKTPEKLEGTAATWIPTKLDIAEDAAAVGVYQRQKELGADVSGLQELMTYGLKGAAAYTAHSRLLGKEDPKVDTRDCFR
jgi:hydroxylamine reductase